MNDHELVETVVRVGQKLADRLITIIEQQEKIMSVVSDALAASVATNATLAAAVVELTKTQGGTSDTVLQPILDQVNATNAALQAVLPPPPPPAAG